MIETAPADTARAMHDSKMRGQDMQDTSEDMPELTMHYPVKPMPDGRIEILHYGGGPVAMFQPFTITEAECQRRIDAAVQAEREAWRKAIIQHSGDMAAIRSEAKAATIRARGQK